MYGSGYGYCAPSAHGVASATAIAEAAAATTAASAHNFSSEAASAGAPGAGPAPGGAALTAAQLAPRKTASGEACRLPVVYQCGPLPICSAEGVVTCCTLCERLSARAFWAALRCAGSGMWSTSTQEQRCGVSAAR